MTIPPSIFNAYNLCPRQAWLMSRNLTADQQNTYLDIGRLISRESFKREKKEIYLADISAKIDMISKYNNQIFVAEIKKSSATMESGILQLKYYLYLLHKKNIKVDGLIKIPKEKISRKVSLTKPDITFIEKQKIKIKKMLNRDKPPEQKKIKICRTCAHNEFCWA